MLENENEVVEESVISASGPVDTEQPEVPAPAPVQESSSERNHRALAETNKRITRERDDALRLLQEKQSIAKQEEPDDDIVIGNDEIAEGKHISKLNREIKKIREELKTYKQTSATMSVEAMLKAQYPDIDKVVSKENLDVLREQDPEFAEMLDTSTSFKAKAISAYKHIKKLGIYVDDTFKSDCETAQSNAAKPKPLVSVSPQQGDSPLSRANAFAAGLTPELKAELRKEMEEARKNR